MIRKCQKTGLQIGILVLFMIVLGVGSGLVLAQSSPIVTIQSGEVISRDKFVGGQIIRNEGLVKGDLFFWGQNIMSKGTIEGDALGMGQDINLSGDVIGNVRAVGSTVTLSNMIGKNVNIFGGVLNITRESTIGGNLIACGGRININGNVKGYTWIAGGSITLNGEFFGDVDINNFGDYDKYDKSEHSKVVLKVLSGTIIHGKLKFRGSEAEIQKGAKVPDFQWIKSKLTSQEWQTRQIYRYIWKFIRFLISTAVYFLMGLFLLRLFPAIFRKMEEFTTQKSWNAIGYGLIALFATIAVAISSVILLIMSLIMSPVFGLVFGIIGITFYMGLFFLAGIPAALWLGSLIGKEKLNPAYRLGVGLIILNLGLFILVSLGKLPTAGPMLATLAFLIRFGTTMIGTGALLYGIREIYRAIKKGESQ